MMNVGNSPFPYDSDTPQQPWEQQPGAPADDMMSDVDQEPSKYEGPKKYPQRANKKKFMKMVQKKARDMMKGGNSPFPYDSDTPQQPWEQQPGAPADDMMKGGNSPFAYDSDTPQQPWEQQPGAPADDMMK